MDLDWVDLVGREDVTLREPSAVLAELDKHKPEGNSRRAQRARRAIQFLASSDFISLFAWGPYSPVPTAHC